MKNTFILLPNQLFKKFPDKRFSHIILLEDHRFFCEFRFHKKKLILHRAAMKYYQESLEKDGRKVTYLDHQACLPPTGLGCVLKKNRVRCVSFYDPTDHTLENRLKTELNEAAVEFEILPSPLFIGQTNPLDYSLAGSSHFSMNTFYIAQRKRLNVLMENDKPRGGKWSFDKQNRQRFSKKIKIPQLRVPGINPFVRQAAQYVNDFFAQNPGTTDDFFYPVTHSDAAMWLNDFIERRLDAFGPYEDAISRDERFLFHSLLSPLLNTGLLTPQEVLRRVMAFCETKPVHLNSLEGFIRQIIGWREFMRIVYTCKGQFQMQSNFWRFDRTMPQPFYDASTGLEPVDFIIKQVLKNAYAHHIERLMILGNFMLLCEIHPQEVYRWFMELFIDAYEWVMIPNVFGMSQYADGGMMTTKPYISSSNYILKMSDFKRGPWCELWDSLFWRFITQHKTVFGMNPRMKLMAVQAQRMGEQKINQYVKRADAYLKQLHKR